MRRILLVLSVAALMVAMMVSMAMPAFAAPGGKKPNTCGLSTQAESVTSVPPGTVGAAMSEQGGASGTLIPPRASDCSSEG